MTDRRQQIFDYIRSGKPNPPMPTVFAPNDPGDGAPGYERVFDFPGSVELQDRAIGAMLDGAPMDIFEWHQATDESALQRNLRSLERWEARQEEKRQTAREAKPPRDIEGDEGDRALGILQWAEDRLASKTEGERDESTRDAIYFLGKFVNDGYLSRAEVSNAVQRASVHNKHYPENKSINQIEYDIDRGLAKAATDGVHVDWDQIDRWGR